MSLREEDKESSVLEARSQKKRNGKAHVQIHIYSKIHTTAHIKQILHQEQRS